MAGIILIVEDHDAVRESLHTWLSISFPRYMIVTAASGEEAVEIVRDVSPDVVVMDISLPGISGIETTRRIKHNAPKAQVIMLTIHEERAYQLDAASAGASAFVPKRQMQALLLPLLETFLPAGIA
jgi:DNA-binding NarL/FixJ family response regulator